MARLATDWNIDIVVLDLALASPELLERLGGCGDSPAIIAIADAESADLAGMALARRNVTFLDPDARDDELSEVLDAALDSAGFAVADGARRDFASISALSREVERIAEALSVLANSERDAALANREVTVAQVRAVIKARRARERYFAAELFSDPAWDMMLDLMAARLEGRAVSVSSLCIAAAVAPTTALRWIARMTEEGLLDRRADSTDRRRAFMALTDVARARMRAYLAALERAGLAVG